MRPVGQVPRLLLPSVPQKIPQAQSTAALPVPDPAENRAHPAVPVVICAWQIASPPVGGGGWLLPLPKQVLLPAVPPVAHGPLPQSAVQNHAVPVSDVQIGSEVLHELGSPLPVPVQLFPKLSLPPLPLPASRNTLESWTTILLSGLLELFPPHATMVTPTATAPTRTTLNSREKCMDPTLPKSTTNRQA